MTDIFLIRHGKTVWNHEVRMQGRKNSPLLEEGIEGAKALQGILDKEDIKRVYASPMPRALQTAFLATGGKIPLEVEPLLEEMDLGDLEGMYAQDFKDREPERFRNFKTRPHLFEPGEGGESYEDVVNRAKKLIVKLCSEEETPILLVTHMILIQAFLCIIEGRNVKTLRDTEFIEQTGLFKISVEKTGKRDYRARVLMRNNKDLFEEYHFNI